ncbi:lipocalin-like domain-containing protein [Bacillus cereus]|uniref:lipocalin-like domain-containing protein n=1 Tax=Bacillus cereus TaxID=1396 RepID=UPI003D96CD8C
MLSSKNLIGSWSLVEFYMETEAGIRSYPFGKLAKGIILYNFDGYMSAVITGEHRPVVSAVNLMEGTVEEQLIKINHLSYSGQFIINGNKVIHYVKVTLFPKWEGKTLIRFIDLKNDLLTLSTEALDSCNEKQKFKFTLKWKKL